MRPYYQHKEKNAGKDTYVEFPISVPESGLYEVRLSYRPGGGRETAVPVTITHSLGDTNLKWNQEILPNREFGFSSMGEFAFEKEFKGSVRISTEGTTGYVIVDALQLVPVKP